MPNLPAGTVTFLFTDVEGSTRLLQEHGEGYAEALAEHRRKVRGSMAGHGGVEVDTQGDAFFFAFASAPDAAAAAEKAQAALAEGSIRVRIGLHTGEPQLTDEGYVGIDVHKAARICSTAHGGQVVLSERTRSLLDGSFPLTDLGLHRLKDLGRPEKLFQLGRGTFPPLRSLNATNLPAQPSPLIGREQEIHDVKSLVRERRLVTLTGAGGSGKTRLGLQVAAELTDEFEDGVFWIPLAALTAAQLVLPTIAATLGATDSPAEYVDEKRMLLLVDNVEHLLACAPALGDLLASCPNLRLLATSRAILRLAGEREYEVPPLPDQDAVTLFRERAVQAEPLDAVREICRRLDGLPLAIELAAARTRTLPPDRLLERLGLRLPLLTGGRRDAPERQRTLRATIEWSHELLEPADQQLFARIAVFSGSFSLESAEQVCEAELDRLESLLEQNLLRRMENARFFFLETIREFALEKLEASAEVEDVRARHAEHFLAVAEEGARHVENPPEQRRWLEHLDADLDNFRAALAWSVEGARSDIGLQLAASLREFWFVRGYYSEGLRWLDSLIGRGTGGSADLPLGALLAAADLAFKVSEHALAGGYAEEALARARAAEDEVAMARSLFLLGMVARVAGDDERRDTLLSESLSRAREAADVTLATRILVNFGTASLEARDLERAGRFYRQSLALSEEAGSEQGIARAHGFLASLALYEDRVEDAVGLSRRCLEIAYRLGWMEAIVGQLRTLGCAYARLGQAERAAKLVAAESRWVEELQLWLEVHHRDIRERAAAEVRNQLDPQRLDELVEEGRALSLDDAVRCALEDDF